MRAPTYRTVLSPMFAPPSSKAYTGPPRESDYYAVPRVETFGHFCVAELARFKITDDTDPKNVEMVLDSSARAQKEIDRRKR